MPSNIPLLPSNAPEQYSSRLLPNSCIYFLFCKCYCSSLLENKYCWGNTPKSPWIFPVFPANAPNYASHYFPRYTLAQSPPCNYMVNFNHFLSLSKANIIIWISIIRIKDPFTSRTSVTGLHSFLWKRRRRRQQNKVKKIRAEGIKKSIRRVFAWIWYCKRVFSTPICNWVSSLHW